MRPARNSPAGLAMRAAWSVAPVLLALSSLQTTAFARAQRDPLTKLEIEQMREIADQPPLRIKLIVKFARERILAIEQVKSSKGNGLSGHRIHDLLEDFAAIIDELDQNLDMYDEQRADLRKALKEVIAADAEFSNKLRAMKPRTGTSDDSDFGVDSDTAKDSPSGAAQSSAAAEEYEFAVENALEAVNGDADTAKEMLDRQNREIEAEKHKK